VLGPAVGERRHRGALFPPQASHGNRHHTGAPHRCASPADPLAPAGPARAVPCRKALLPFPPGGRPRVTPVVPPSCGACARNLQTDPAGSSPASSRRCMLAAAAAPDGLTSPPMASRPLLWPLVPSRSRVSSPMAAHPWPEVPFHGRTCLQAVAMKRACVDADLCRKVSSTFADLSSTTHVIHIRLRRRGPLPQGTASPPHGLTSPPHGLTSPPHGLTSPPHGM
jgi:hypothetical protein